METTRRWPLLLAGLTGFLLCLALFPPVGWLGERLAKATGDRLTLSGTQGTLWDGDTQLVLFDGTDHRAIPGRLAWRIRPLAWFDSGEALLSLQHPSLDQPLAVSKKPEGLVVSGGQLNFPAAWLEATGTPWNTLKPGGTIRLAWGNITAGQSFAVNLRWQDAQSALSVVKPLGNYEVLANIGPDGSMTARLGTLSGDLQLEGQASWSAPQGFGFSGYASASPSQQVALTGLLSQMGRLENNRYRLGS